MLVEVAVQSFVRDFGFELYGSVHVLAFKDLVVTRRAPAALAFLEQSAHCPGIVSDRCSPISLAISFPFRLNILSPFFGCFFLLWNRWKFGSNWPATNRRRS